MGSEVSLGIAFIHLPRMHRGIDMIDVALSVFGYFIIIICLSSSSRFAVVEVRSVTRYSAVRLTLLFSIALCCWPFLPTFYLPVLFLGLSPGRPPIKTVVFLVFCNLLTSFFVSGLFLVISRLSF